MDTRDDAKLEDLIVRELYTKPGYEAILLPSLFTPPIMLSNIFRIACQLKKKGLTSPPDRRMGGWHLKLKEAGVSYCQDSPGAGAGRTHQPRL